MSLSKGILDLDLEFYFTYSFFIKGFLFAVVLFESYLGTDLEGIIV